MSEIPVDLQKSLVDRYRLERLVGRGGMAKVFLAEDLKHRRPVAIKVLDPEIGALIGPERFQSEIEITARLIHPHIVPLYDSGAVGDLLYYVMPYVVGETLRDKLRRDKQCLLEEVLRVARELGEALDDAHRQGIVHRDVKPENVMLSHGHALLADFGIARAVEAPVHLTRTGSAVGTPLYMSPEQIQSRNVDGRSDQYSLACVLFEMLTGQPPFSGATAEVVLMHHLATPPRSVTDLRPEVSKGTAEALLRAMAKDPADRFPSVGALSEALEGGRPRGRGHRAPLRRLMLAVLPLENMSADAEQEYFSDGATEELIAQLGRLRPQQLGVIARTSAMRYKRSTKSIGEIGRELNVDYVLEGSARHGAGRIRINVQLIRVNDQTQMWAETYERDPADILAIQSDVASRVASSLAVELLPAQTTPVPTSTPASYEAYLKGRYFWNRGTTKALERAIGYFEQSIRLDDLFARAHAALADCYLLLASHLALPTREAHDRARTAATRAIELDQGLAEAHTSLAGVRFNCDRDWVGAEQEFLKALDIDPGYPPAHYWYGLLLIGLGRFEESRRQLERARELDPFSASIIFALGDLSLCQREYRTAAQRFREALDLNAELQGVRLMIGETYALEGRFAEAFAEIDLALERGRTCAGVSILAHACGLAGRRDDARRLLREVSQRSQGEPVRADLIAAVHAALGETDDAFRWLELAFEGPGIGLLDLKVGPRFDPLRGDPRYGVMVRRLGLEP